MHIKFKESIVSGTQSEDTSFIGQIRYGMWATNPDGWLACNGDTIGNIGSGGDRANTVYWALYDVLWDGVSDSDCPVIGGRGISALDDWNALKSITLPDARGRSPMGHGPGAGLTNRTVGEHIGEESHILTLNENGPHTHSQTVPTSQYRTNGGAYGAAAAAGSTTGSSGSGSPHNNIQPVLVCRVIIKYQ